MKNNKLFFLIYFSLLIICIITFIILYILGAKERVGYLYNFTFDINRTLELNGLNVEETKKIFTTDDKLDNDAIINYIFTNEAITNYRYGFKIGYYSKIFKHSDIYVVYPNTVQILKDNNFIKEVTMDDKGGPFGNLISEKTLEYNEKIDNIVYTLSLKAKFVKYFILFVCLICILICTVYFWKKLKLFLFEKKYYILIAYSIFIAIFILFLIVNLNIIRKSNLTDLHIISESKAGYVYKAKIENYKNSKLFSINNNSIQVNNTNYIKYYGYSLEITNKPEGSWYNDDNIYYTNNNAYIIDNKHETNGYKYNIQLTTYIGNKYKITIFANQLGSNGNVSWYLNEENNYKEINNKDISNGNIILSDIRNILSYTNEFGSLYLIFPKGITEVESILIESLNTNLNFKDGYTVFTTKNKIDNNQILEINYKMKNKFITNILILFILMLAILLYMYFMSFNLNKLFYIFIFVVGIVLFIFHFWLGFPGYYNYIDAFTIMTEAINNVYNNWHPFIIGLTLHILYKIFGYHTFYIFFINLFLWYVGLSLIIVSLYYKYKNKLVILLFALSFLANIFFANITHLKDITATLFFFFSISILIFQIIVDVKNKIFNIILNVIMYISLIFALLWRHNFIVTIYPIFIVIVYRHLKNIDNKKYFLLKFCSIMLIIAFLLIAIVKISPVLFAENNNKSYAPAPLILYQIVWCAVLSNDGSLIPDEWYAEDKSFSDVAPQLYKSPRLIDHLVIGDNIIFSNYSDKKKLKEVLIKYIIKHPKSYIQFIVKFSIWAIVYTEMFIHVDQNSIQSYGYGITDTYKKIFTDDVGIKLSPIKYNIYSFLYNNKIYIRPFYSVILSIALFFITGFIWLFRSGLRDDFLLLSFSLAFSAFATAVIVCLFSTSGIYRYISPVVIISILSLVSFFIYRFKYKK
ncbi:hypothetical protein A966_01918 [Brachyspira hampsonii 30446]|uniref:Uncharacterized protein n=2 Tax=Brachyspira hampsonii TaxID=1287055 RepID=A0A2U4F5N4_9SPIR|nr:hypothetical protein [Brachyspira hampsonii]EKV58037.1 hypothetical protein A966_01918 [Brachyspira hampsonii 30446]OEJ16731.1 hypothetical protein A9495_08540 [Brachyspira hampsonii]